MQAEPRATADALDAVVAEYLEAVERGEPADRTEWLARYPEHAADLAAFFAAETRFDSMVAPLRTVPVGDRLATPSGHDVTPPADRPPRAITGYDLLEEIGRGGMGVIYKARQRAVSRLVAVKMLRAGEWATPAELLRFRWEAEAVGALDHPNIVPVYEVGTVPSGDGLNLPFFSMKLIDGGSLARRRELFRRDWSATARLLVLVARAVEHAHQRGILHRDLKPANILLGEDGPAGGAVRVGNASLTPYVSDFGLAARAQGRPGQTLPGTIVGTPAYLAPELAAGKAATIGSDVYALGAILYELLTGAPPVGGNSPLETLQLLTGRRVAPPRSANPRVPADLETICLKCLEPEPASRYATAGKLADDLEHFLAGRPITARPVGRLSALRRWCRRNPVIAGLAAALILLAAVSFPLILWNWRRAVEHERLADVRLQEAVAERGRADEGFGLAHRAFDDLFRMIGNSDAEGLAESDALNKELLERGLTYYHQFVDRRRDDPAMRHELASAVFRIAAISQRLKTQREAVEAHDRAIAFLRTQLDQFPGDERLRELLSRSLTLRGKALAQLDRPEDALRSHDEAVAVWSSSPADSAATIRGRGIALMDRGVALINRADWAAVLDTLCRARDTLLSCPDARRVQSPLAICYLNLAAAQTHLDRLDGARQAAAEGLRIADLLHRQQPTSEEAQSLMAQSHHRLAKVELKAGNLAISRQELQAAQVFFEGLRRAKPRNTQYRRSLATVFGDISDLEKQAKRPTEAVRAEEQAVGLLRELVQQDGEARMERAFLGHASAQLGHLHREAKDYSAAAAAYEESRAHRLFLLDRRPADRELRLELARTGFYLGACLGNIQKRPEALAATDQAIEHFRDAMKEKEIGEGDRRLLASSLGNRAILLRDLGRPAEAIAATEERRELFPASPDALVDAARDFARTYNWVLGHDGPMALREKAAAACSDTLRRAWAAGASDRARVLAEAVFNKVRDSGPFQKLLRDGM